MNIEMKIPTFVRFSNICVFSFLPIEFSFNIMHFLSCSNIFFLPITQLLPPALSPTYK